MLQHVENFIPRSQGPPLPCSLKTPVDDLKKMQVFPQCCSDSLLVVELLIDSIFALVGTFGGWHVDLVSLGQTAQ